MLKQSFGNFLQLTEENKALTLKIQEKDAHIKTLTDLITNISTEYARTPKEVKHQQLSTNNEYSWNVINRNKVYTPITRK